MKQYGVLPRGRVVNVARFRSDVQITAQGKLIIRITMTVKVTSQAVEPDKFIGELVAADDLPIRYIHTDDPYTFYTGSEKACLFFFLAIVELSYYIHRRGMRQDSNAIVSSLARDSYVVI
jgi:hypothetical protein